MMHTASFCKYDYLKLVLSAPPRLVDAFGTRVSAGAELGRGFGFHSHKNDKATIGRADAPLFGSIR